MTMDQQMPQVKVNSFKKVITLSQAQVGQSTQTQQHQVL